MKQKKSLEMYNSMPIPKAVILNAFPAIIAMLMALVYNLADTFFIGQTHDAYQVAASSIATPVFLIFMALGSIFGIGGTSVISRAFGEGRPDYARQVSSFCMWGSVAVGFVVSALFLLFMDPMLSVIGASSETWDFTKSYLTIVTCGGIFSMLSSCYSNVLRAEGEAGRAMTGQIIGNGLNVVLDAAAVLVFHMGITGCAVATLIGQTAGALYYILYLVSGKSSLSIRPKDFRMGNGILTDVCAIGIPASLATLLMSVSSIIMNILMAGFGDLQIAAIGVAMKISFITGMISMGIGQGIQPLLGYCFGAGERKRYTGTLKCSVLFATIVGCTMTVLCYLLSRQLSACFLSDQEALGYAVHFVRIIISTGPLYGIIYVFLNAIQAMGAGTAALIINLSRQGVAYIPAMFIMSRLIGADGLAWSQPIADVFSLVLSSILIIVTVKRKWAGRASE